MANLAEDENPRVVDKPYPKCGEQWLHTESGKNLDESSIKILEYLAEKPWQRAKEIETAICFSTATTNQRLRKMVEQRFLVRKSAPNTENKYYPTYLYALYEDLDLHKLDQQIARLKLVQSQIPKIDLLKKTINRINYLEERIKLLEDEYGTP